MLMPTYMYIMVVVVDSVDRIGCKSLSYLYKVQMFTTCFIHRSNIVYYIFQVVYICVLTCPNELPISNAWECVNFVLVIIVC